MPEADTCKGRSPAFPIDVQQIRPASLIPIPADVALEFLARSRDDIPVETTGQGRALLSLIGIGRYRRSVRGNRNRVCPVLVGHRVGLESHREGKAQEPCTGDDRQVLDVFVSRRRFHSLPQFQDHESLLQLSIVLAASRASSAARSPELVVSPHGITSVVRPIRGRENPHNSLGASPASCPSLGWHYENGVV